MKTNYFIENAKKGFIALMLIFCGLFASTANAQQDFLWTGASSSAWETPGNWTVGGAATPNYPGEISNADTVIINDNSIINAPIISGAVPNAVKKVTISNANGTVAGATLTINPGGTLNATTSVASGPIELSGGNLVNNGTLNVTNTNAGAGTTFGIQCSTPAQLPGSPTVWGYSGNGTVSVNISAATINDSSAFNVGGVDAFAGNSTYKFIFNGTTNISLATGTATVTTYAVRTGGVAGSGPIPAIIGGTGFTLGGSNGGLVRVGAASTITVDTGTTLTLNSANTNASFGINLASQNVNVTKFINKGTINILGSMTKTAIQLSPGVNDATKPVVMVFENQNVVNVNINGVASNAIPLYVVNNGNPASPCILEIKNTSTATMTLTNNEPSASNIGNALKVANATATPTVIFTNDGILSLTGTDVVYDNIGRSTITNNGTINTNQEFTKWKINNNTTGIITAANNGASLENFLPGVTTNSGIINTGAGTLLSRLEGVTTDATSVINPGGTSGKGIADFNGTKTYTLSGIFKLQVSGDALAGVDFDQITSSGVGGGFDLTAAVLDVTGIYTPVSDDTIDIVTTEATGTLTGTFSSVVGLAANWQVNYISGVGGKVQLLYFPSLSTQDLAKFNFRSYPNPVKESINVSAAKSINKIEIYNLLGQQVVKRELNSSGAKINVSSLSKGIYVVRAYIDDAVGSYKFIKE